MAAVDIVVTKPTLGIQLSVTPVSRDAKKLANELDMVLLCSGSKYCRLDPEEGAGVFRC